MLAGVHAIYLIVVLGGVPSGTLGKYKNMHT